MSARRMPTRRLPRHPNLRQLRKQAKDLHATRPELTLSEAQRELARSYGYPSWPKLKAFVDGANVARLAAAVQAGDVAQVRSLLRVRPELVSMDMAGDNEHRALHYAVLRRDAAMVRLLMQNGADARKGIFPHRDATSPMALARDRDYTEIVAILEAEEQRRRQNMSCPNASVSPVQEQIVEAIERGDRQAAIALLEADPPLIAACDRNGATPLHAAAQACDEEMLAWLLAHNANPRKEDLAGLTPLDRAAQAADPRNDGAELFPAVARRLLAAGAVSTPPGAVAMGDVDRIRDLARDNPNLPRQGIDWRRGGLLSVAVRHGHVDMVRLLLELGADVNERVLLTELEEPTESAGQPLWMAALSGRHDIAELLLDRGADPNANPYASGWALDNAYRRQDEAMKQLLLGRGAKPQPWTVTLARDLDAARRMLADDAGEEVVRELAWSAACNGCPEILALVLPRLTWTTEDPRWNWILIQPIRSCGDGGLEEPYFACMELLLERGVDPNVSSRFGQTVLHFAAARPTVGEEARVRFTAMLLDHGARLDVRDELLQSTPLGWACRWGRTGMAQRLIARGASIEEPDAEPWATPRAWAVKMGHTELAAMLESTA